jgi:hypothetical protein
MELPMESDLPVPIDDSLNYASTKKPPIHDVQMQHDEEEEEYEEPRYYYPPPPQPQYMMPPPQPQQTQKKTDIFSELDRIHWIIFIATVLLAFFMGKSISTPIIIRSS